LKKHPYATFFSATDISSVTREKGKVSIYFLWRSQPPRTYSFSAGVVPRDPAKPKVTIRLQADE